MSFLFSDQQEELDWERQNRPGPFAHITEPPVEIRPLASWGSAEDKFPGVIDWMRRENRDLLPRHQMYVGCYVSGNSAYTFQLYFTADGMPRATIQLPHRKVIGYTEYQARVQDRHGRVEEMYYPVYVKPGEMRWVQDWCLRKEYNPETFAHMGAHPRTVWEQCKRMAHPFAKLHGRQWAYDMGQASVQVSKVITDPHEFKAFYLRMATLFGYVQTYLAENLEKARGPVPDNSSNQAFYTRQMYSEFVEECRRILAGGGPYRVVLATGGGMAFYTVLPDATPMAIMGEEAQGATEWDTVDMAENAAELTIVKTAQRLPHTDGYVHIIDRAGEVIKSYALKDYRPEEPDYSINDLHGGEPS